MPLAFTTGTSSHPKNTLRKRKFKIKVLVLLHVLIPGVMLSSLETINPWLSACDLVQPASSDLQGSCIATQLPPKTTSQRDGEMLSCPMQCHNETDTENPQCLHYLDGKQREAICGKVDLEHRTDWLEKFLVKIRLRHCCEYKLIETLSETLLKGVLKGKDECFRIIDSLVDVDNLAARVSCEFTEVLSRFDCGQPYSVRFSCEDCKEAYRRWVCSSLLPYFNGTVRIRPCRSVCQAVEQRCPYFLPENRAPALPTQYAGEPTFLCMDPNIPETGVQLQRSLYPEKDACCVKSCGSPFEGLCIEKGLKCEEELISYKNATNQSVDCSASDTTGSRVPSSACIAPVQYNSPHNLGSGTTLIKPKPLIIILTTSLIHPVSNRFHLFTLFFIFNYLFHFPVINLILCIYLILINYSTLKSLIIRSKKLELFFYLIKTSKLIFNYFKFNSNKWQYYFILISVNLLFNLFNKNPKPLTTPSCLINGFITLITNNKKSEKTRGTRHYYYKIHYFSILSNIAQKKLNDYVLDSLKFCGFKKWKPLKLLSDYLVLETIKIKINDKCIIINENSLSINRIKIHSLILIKILLIKDLRYRLMDKRNERLKNSLKRFLRVTTNDNNDDDDDDIVEKRTNANNKSTCMFLYSLRPYKYVWYYIIKRNINEKCSKKYYKWPLFKPVHLIETNIIVKIKWKGHKEIKLESVKLCCFMKLVCSDPKCEFQTFFFKS